VIPTDDELIQRIRRDLADSYDEEFELDLEDRNLDDMAESAVDTEQSSSPTERVGACISANCSDCRVNWSNCRTGWSKPARKL
jgi:hypothetical protein